MTLTFLYSKVTNWRSSSARPSGRKKRSWSRMGTMPCPKHGSFWKFLAYGPEYLEAFDGELFRELVDKIIVESNERIRFRLINGLELPEEIERTVR